ncbi:MAG: hypothetical protein V7768_12335 [Dietzia cercidiphylli]
MIGGLAAALIHRERWYAPAAVEREVDIYAVGTAPAPGRVRLRRLRRALPAGQVEAIGGLRVTSAARTAIDVARWEVNDDTAIAKIDAVCNRSRIAVSEVSALARGLRGLHGLQRVRSLLRWCDQRADSPPETRLRLLIVRSDLPDPTPQVEIHNEYGVKVATADLAYEVGKVAVFYDGDVHRGRSTWEYDARVNAELSELGWQVVRFDAPESTGGTPPDRCGPRARPRTGMTATRDHITRILVVPTATELRCGHKGHDHTR